MKFAHPDWCWLVFCISALVFLAVGARRFRAANDFIPVYTGARCLLHGCNPYDTSQLEKEFLQAGGHAVELPSWDIDVPVYPPSTFLALAPLAPLRFPVARALWFVLNGCLFVTSAWLIVSMCSAAYRWLATCLASVFLLTSSILLVLGQPAIFAISLLVIGCCLLLRGRMLPLAAFLLMLSVAVKPQIGGLIVLYFVAQRIHWRYAAGALAGAAALLLCAGLILGLHPHSAGWVSTLRTNLSATLSPGGSADPRPANQQAIGDINLQALTSIFFQDARTFNAVAYGIFLALLVLWVMAFPLSGAGPEMHLPALAALAVLSLTPVYHRFYDTRMLLLTIPAVLAVFHRRRVLGSLIAVMTALAGISVQYRLQVLLLQHGKWEFIQTKKILFLLLLRQQSLELLLLFCLYVVAAFSLRSANQPIEAHAQMDLG